jgi:hypothetical protein
MDENQQNEEETTSVEETQEQTQVETDNSQQKTEHTESEKRLYARAKTAEEIAQKAKAEADALKKELAKAKLPISDVDAILEVQNATSGFDTDEVTELRLRASALGTSLSKAREDKNFQLWQRGQREEVNKSKALAPNTNQGEVDKPKGLNTRLLEAKTQEEKEKILNEIGMNPLNPRREYTSL